MRFQKTSTLFAALTKIETNLTGKIDTKNYCHNSIKQ